MAKSEFSASLLEFLPLDSRTNRNRVDLKGFLHSLHRELIELLLNFHHEFLGFLLVLFSILFGLDGDNTFEVANTFLVAFLPRLILLTGFEE